MDAPINPTEEPSLAPEPASPAGEPSARTSDVPPGAEPVLSPSPDAPPSPRSRASRRKTTQLAAAENAPPTALSAIEPTSGLEERIRRLEDALAQMQQLQSRPSPPIAAQVQRLPAAPAPVGPSAADLLLNVGKRLFSNPTPAPSAPANVVPAATPPAPIATTSSTPTSHLWLLLDTIAELRAIFRMFVDPRYHLPWSARVVPLILLVAILTSYFWVPTAATIPLLGFWVNKAVDLILAFFLFKVLGHESRRYRQTSPDLPPHLRL